MLSRILSLARAHCSYQYGEMTSNNTVIICNGVGAAVGVFYLIVVGTYFKKKRELFKTYALTALSGVVLALYVIGCTPKKKIKPQPPASCLGVM